jgi:hypothetical protein
MKNTIPITVFILFNLSVSGQDSSFNYDYVYPYRDGFTLVVKDKKFGVLNSQFKEVLPPVLESINFYDLSDYYYEGMLYAVMNDSTVYYDTLGNRIKAVDNPDIYPPTFTNRNIDSLDVSGAPGFLGVETKSQETIIPFLYNNIFTGWKNHIVARRSYNSANVILSKNEPARPVNESVIYNHHGDTLFYHQARVFFWDKASIYFIENDTAMVAYDTSFNKLNLAFQRVWPFGDTLCWIQKEDKWNLVNSKFELVLEKDFEYIYANEYWTAVKKEGKFGFVNSKGRQITELEYNDTWRQYVGDSPLIVAYKGDKPYFLNMEGACIFNCD